MLISRPPNSGLASMMIKSSIPRWCKVRAAMIPATPPPRMRTLCAVLFRGTSKAQTVKHNKRRTTGVKSRILASEIRPTEVKESSQYTLYLSITDVDLGIKVTFRILAPNNAIECHSHFLSTFIADDIFCCSGRRCESARRLAAADVMSEQILFFRYGNLARDYVFNLVCGFDSIPQSTLVQCHSHLPIHLGTRRTRNRRWPPVFSQDFPHTTLSVP